MRFFYFFIASTLIAIIALFSSSKLEAKNKSSHLISKGLNLQSYPIAPFEKLSFSGSMNVFVKQGEKCNLKIEGSKSDLENIEIKQNGEALYIGIKKNSGLTFISNKMDIFITTPRICEIILNGSVSVNSENEFHLGVFKIVSRGSGKVNLALNAKKLEVNIKGSSKVFLSGYVQHQNVNISGSGSYEANKLISESTNASVFGSGTANLHVERELNAKAFGSARIFYKGSPIVRSQTYGSGRIKAA